MKYDSEIRTIFIDPVPQEKLWAWTRMAKGEVSALGLVEAGSGAPCITDVFLVKQRCSAAHTEMDQNDVAKLMFDLAAAGQEGRLRAWIHSHATMEVFWSKTDDDTIEGLGGDPYFVSVVVNKKGDIRARVDVFKPIRFVIDDVPVKVRMPDLGIEEECRREFDAKVSEAPPVSLFPRGTSLFGDAAAFDLRGQHDLPFGMPDLDEMEMAVRRGEVSMSEYLAAVEAQEGVLDLDGGVEHGRVS